MTRIMIVIIIISSSLLLLFVNGHLFSNDSYHKETTLVKGLSFVAPRDSFTSNPFLDIKKIEANYISVIPYAFMRQDDPNVYYRGTEKRWWGESPEGVLTSIKMAHDHHLSVMLKPSVWMHRAWTGDIMFEQASDLEIWKKTYRKYILGFAKMADSLDVDIFCIGNEFKQLVFKHPDYWYDLIDQVKVVYDGKITYAANWDAYQKVAFWDALDYIGINAYFPLSEKHNVSKKDLIASWKPIERKINHTATAFGKPVLFTEYGYLSVDGTTHNTWELEKKMHDLPINEAAQAQAFDALYSVFWEKDYWEGGFIWKWYPNKRHRLEYQKRDYSPQGKITEKTIQQWFQKDN